MKKLILNDEIVPRRHRSTGVNNAPSAREVTSSSS